MLMELKAFEINKEASLGGIIVGGVYKKSYGT